MCDHDDKPLACDLLDEVHDLDTGLGIERARRLVCQQNGGIVDERTRNGDALHLSARELIGLFVQFPAEADPRERFDGASFALFAAHARNGERKLDVPQDRLVRNEVVGLENKSDPMISVDVPVAVLIILCRTPFNDKVARRIVIQAADDVEKRRLAAARRAEDADKFVFAKFQAHAFERVNIAGSHFVVLPDIRQFQHIHLLIRPTGARSEKS